VEVGDFFQDRLKQHGIATNFKALPKKIEALPKDFGFFG
jgi:hypothetical protein